MTTQHLWTSTTIIVPEQAWEAMDFINCLPRSLGKSAVFVVVDRLTKFAHFIPLAHPYTVGPEAHDED